MAVTPSPKESLKQYEEWLVREELMASLDSARSGYEKNRDLVLEHIARHDFWEQINNNELTWTEEFRNQTTYGLFRPKIGVGLDLVGKPWESYFEKTWRLNILQNRNAPQSPPQPMRWWIGDKARRWIKPKDLYLLNDVVRGTIVVRYLDGVRFLAARLEKLAESMSLPCEVIWQAQSAGHHAAHLYIDFECDWIDGGVTASETFKVEIQIVTEIRNVVREITHWSYENSRVGERRSGEEQWQWNPFDPAFVPNFLGHLVQYIDGTIVVARDAIQEETQ